MDFPQNLSDHMPEKIDPIVHNGKQNVLIYRTWQNLLKFLQGVILIQFLENNWPNNRLTAPPQPLGLAPHLDLPPVNIALLPQKQKI